MASLADSIRVGTRGSCLCRPCGVAGGPGLLYPPSTQIDCGFRTDALGFGSAEFQGVTCQLA